MHDTVLSSQQLIVIELDRDIGLANAEPWGECLCQAIDWARGDIVVDLSAVPVIHSRGLAMMARVHHHAMAKDCSVTWRGTQPWLPRVLEITGLDPSAPKCGPEVTVTAVQLSEWSMRCARQSLARRRER